ncbi:aldolase/citrate lyase family protein [Streptomyces sp. C10]|uniref:aldolase/citrate lyase family protein n=1 Tax=Streptomyces sp. C10 TaxID=531941 RepID=UPI00397EE843
MRSLNGGRGPGFGRIDPAEYLRRANAEIMLIALLEDAEGIEAIDEILSPGGVDLVLPGPGDLSQSYGVPWQVRHPRVQEAVRTLREACARHTVPFCAMSTTPERRAQWRADGVTAFVVGEDRDLTARALRGHLARTAGRE